MRELEREKKRRFREWGMQDDKGSVRRSRATERENGSE